MAVEPRRGCGWRKVGGLYLVGAGMGAECCKLPIILTVCPCCGTGVKQARGWTWIDPRPWLEGPCTALWRTGPCPAVDPARMGDKVGLLWIGTAFYKTPADFIREGTELGISRRIKAVPRGFKVGEHWVFLAHPHVREVRDGDALKWEAGIFRIFKPTAIEMIITKTMSEDAEVMADLEARGITAVIVPDDDKDHQGSVYDKEDDDEPELPMGGAVAEATA
jgi:hypothetical protein